jgi:hypothetical protein
MKALSILGMFLALASPVGAQDRNLKTLDEVKQWHFDLQQGGLDFELDSYARTGHPQDTVLSMFPASAGSTIAANEEADLLRKIFQEMPSLGYDPRDLARIGTVLDGSGLQEGVDLAVTRSGEWRSCIGLKNCYVAQVAAERYLKSVDAFKEFDNVLGAYGLERKRVSFDEIACKKAPESGSASQSNSEAQAEVFCGGLILIDLRKLGR